MTDKERIAKLESHISRLLDQHDNISRLFELSGELAQASAKNFAALEDRIAALEQNQQ